MSIYGVYSYIDTSGTIIASVWVGGCLVIHAMLDMLDIAIGQL